MFQIGSRVLLVKDQGNSSVSPTQTARLDTQKQVTVRGDREGEGKRRK
jgi:hypothetical protein